VFGMKICILGPRKRKQQELWLIEEAKKQFDKVTYVEIPMVRIENNEPYFKNTKLSEYDCILPRVPRTYKNFGYVICKLLEDRVYMPIKPESILIAHNKFLTLLALEEAGIPIPKTFLTWSRKGVEPVLGEFEYPVVLKILYGSLGKGVMFAESKQSLLPLLDTIETMNEPIFIEEYIEAGGKDIRALVIGDEVIAAMQRSGSKGERRANIGSGGKGKKIKLKPKLEELAIKTAKALGLEIAGIDIIQQRGGKREPLVIEANVNVVFEEITKVTKTNIAKHIVEYVKNEALTTKRESFLKYFSKMIEPKWRK